MRAYIIVNKKTPHQIKIIGQDGKVIDNFDVDAITVEQDKAEVKPYIFVNLSKN
jgi:negative regulator of sigma E activity